MAPYGSVTTLAEVSRLRVIASRFTASIVPQLWCPRPASARNASAPSANAVLLSDRVMTRLSASRAGARHLRSLQPELLQAPVEGGRRDAQFLGGLLAVAAAELQDEGDVAPLE